MMSRDDMNLYLLVHANPAMSSEFSYHRELDTEIEEGQTWDEVSMLFDIDATAEDNNDRKLMQECRRLLIAIGFYRVMPADEIANTTVSSGSKWSFKRAGVAYTSDFTASAWQSAAPGWNIRA